MFAPFSRNTVEFSGVIVLFVGSTATAKVTALVARNNAKIPPKITN
jgi:hypothetical protein